MASAPTGSRRRRRRARPCRSPDALTGAAPWAGFDSTFALYHTTTATDAGAAADASHADASAHPDAAQGTDASAPAEFTHAFYEASRASAFAGYRSWYGPQALRVVGDYVDNSAWANLVRAANFATAHHKPFDLGEWGVMRRNDGHGGLDDPDFIQHIHDLMRGAVPGMTAGFIPGYASYFEANSDGGTTETRLRSTGSYTTIFPRAAAQYLALFGN